MTEADTIAGLRADDTEAAARAFCAQHGINPDIVVDEWNRLLAELATLRESLAKAEGEIAKLSDPLAVHINMVRGTIAKPSIENIRHLYPEIAKGEFEARTTARAAGERRASDLQSQVERLAGALETIIQESDRFRKQLPVEWEGDPLQVACEAGREALASLKETPDAG